MVSGAAYVVLAALVIIITIMVWNRKVDKYSHIHGCQTRYRNILDATERNLKVQECLGHQIMKYGGQQCAKDDDCQQSQVCVLGGYYTGDDGNVFPNPNIGTCMDENDPGAVQWKRKSGFHRPHLPDHHHDDPSFPYKLPNHLPDALHGIGSSGTCVSRCLARGADPATCKSECGLPGPPSVCMRKCLSERGTQVGCQAACNLAPPDDPSHPYKNATGGALGTQKGECLSRCMSERGDLSTCQNMCGLPNVNLKGPAVACASRCMSESSQYGDYSMDMAKNCRVECGLPNPPSACMRRCKSEGGSAAECHGICDPPTHPDDDDSPPTWAFTMSGEISPSKVENYKSETCLPGMYWNSYGNGGRGGCENIFQGSSSARYLHHQKPDSNTEVSIPGTTLPGYGVGRRDPMDKPTGVIIDSDPGYIHPY